MSKEKLSFQAEVSKLLDIVAHSLYSHKEIFLRELISNASDACDKVRYESQTRSELIDGDADFKISLAFDSDAKTLSIRDNGIGMSREDLIENLGTIARSGTEAFVKSLGANAKGDVNLIGQFGVGFYSAFMVADKVEVTTRKAGADQAWLWTSDGKGEFTIADTEKAGRGTSITLYLNEEGIEFADDTRLRHVVRTYSDHIAVPIVLPGEDGAEDRLNTASALWTRDKKDIDADQYKEFYHHVSHNFDDPWLTLHNRNEGIISYTNLVYVPTNRPMDIFHPDRKPGLKLYVKRVFITDDCDDLMPGYLRFVRGIVDAEDLPLNISRENLQDNPVLAKIRRGLVKRVLGTLTKKADKTPEEYATFWEAFGPLIKEGLYEDYENRDTLLPLARFQTTQADGLSSLADYVERMKEGQDAIYYIAGDDQATLQTSPQIEGFAAKGVEVLLLTDPVDEFWIPTVGTYQDKRFVSVTRGGADLDKFEPAADPADEAAAKKDDVEDTELDALIATIKIALGESVKDVRKSNRLTDSAVCLVADDGDMDMHLQRMLKAHGQLQEGLPKILEINAGHGLVKRLAGLVAAGKDKALVDDAAHLLLDQARIIEGEPLGDPAAFARRLSHLMTRGLG